MKVEIQLIKKATIKRKIIEKCDMAFINGITMREDYEKIFSKIDKYAIFISAGIEKVYVGYAAIYVNDLENNVAYITMIGVVDSVQGLHIGSMLMDKCIEISKMNGMRKIRLEVSTDNKKAIRFYYHKGFVYEKKCSEQSDYLIMQL